MSITRTYTVDVAITPQELAAAFCEMDSNEQAEFFAEIWQIAKAWPGAGWCQQSCDIIRCLEHDGLEAVRTLASHLPADTLRTLVEQAA